MSNVPRKPSAMSAPTKTTSSTVESSSLIRSSKAAPLSDFTKERGRITAARVALGTRLAAAKKARAVFLKSKSFKSSFSPTNLEVFVNAFDGAFAGMVSGRALLVGGRNSFSDPFGVAYAWAQEFDAVWDSATALDECEAELILLTSYGAWIGRTGDMTQLPASYTTAVTNCIIAVVDVDTTLIDLGITPNTWNAGGGGGGVSSQSGYAQPISPAVSLTNAYQTVIGDGPLSMTIASGAQRACIFGQVQIPTVPGSSSGSPTVSCELLIDGAAVASTVGVEYSPGTLTSVQFRSGVLTVGAHTFDLRALSPTASGNPTAAGSLVVIVTP